jgi:hypothetical protein
MRTEDKRLMLAGHALSGLLASQPEDKGWNLDALSVVSLKIADTVIEMSSLQKLPDLEVAQVEKPETPTDEEPQLQS